MADRSKIVSHRGLGWSGVPVREYKAEGEHFRAISRRTLLGDREDEQALSTQLRYFEIQPGGYSSLERHEHPHTVMVLRGCGHVILGKAAREISAFDCVYVAPQELHQFHATGDEPLGFLCIVDRERDRPRLASEDEIAELRKNPEIAALLDRATPR